MTEINQPSDIEESKLRPGEILCKKNVQYKVELVINTGVFK